MENRSVKTKRMLRSTRRTCNFNLAMSASRVDDESMSNSDFEADSGNESSDVYSPSERSSSEEEVSEDNSESDDSSSENISSVWTRVYPPEPAVNTAFEFTERNPGVKNMPPPQILLKTVNEMRRFANQHLHGKDLSPGSRMSRWEQLKFGVDHLKKYLGLTWLM